MIKGIKEGESLSSKINELIQVVNELSRQIGITQGHYKGQVERKIQTDIEKECKIRGIPGGSCRCGNPKECIYGPTGPKDQDTAGRYPYKY